MDKLQQYKSIRESLVKEKQQLEARLKEINRVMGREVPVPFLKEKSGEISSPFKKRRAKRVENKMSLKEAVIAATNVKPLAKKEILEAIKKLGYRFAAKDPMNSLNVILYTKKQFKNQDGKFSPAK
jgi:hypothetical protein